MEAGDFIGLHYPEEHGVQSVAMALTSYTWATDYSQTVKISHHDDYFTVGVQVTESFISQRVRPELKAHIVPGMRILFK